MLPRAPRYVAPAFAVALFLSLAAGSPVLAIDPVSTSRFGNVAIGGYDAVAYFEDGRSIEGEKNITHEYLGAIWRFATAAHRDAFAADPERYAPQYGGYCAFAVSKGYTAAGDPDAWTIHEDKLYLNYSKSVREQWRQDIPGNVAKADVNWPEILAE